MEGQYSKQRLPTESITVSTSFNQAWSTVDPTYTPYQPDSESEPNAVLNQTGDSQTGAMILPKKD